jgi:hypothetical protein
MQAKCPSCGEPLVEGGTCEHCWSSIAVDAPTQNPVPLPMGTAQSSPTEPSGKSNTTVPPVAPGLPRPLPRPLGDPLRSLRGPMIVTVMGSVFVGLLSDRGVAEKVVGVVGAVCYVLFMLLLLPSRAADVLYLRSFRRDTSTPHVRKVLQRELGPDIRVSGIRDPRRRWFRPLRYLNIVVFTLKYATTRYLNLEAGSDWKARLWRSLCEARGAVLDISDLTSYVVDELWLCLRTLSLERILFVGDGSKSEGEWRREIATILRLPPEAPIQLAIWGENRESRAAFAASVRAFRQKLPESPRGVHPGGSELIAAPSVVEGSGSREGEVWTGVIAASVLWSVASIVLTVFLQIGGPELYLLVCVVMSVYGLIFLGHLLVFIRDAPFARERLLVGAMAGMVLSIPVTAVAAEQLRIATARLRTENQLKQLGLAVHFHNDVSARLPAADAPFDERVSGSNAPAVSWRVRVLPSLMPHDRDDAARITAVLQGYRVSEPWDSPHNRQFIERMPQVYRHPMAGGSVPPGYTHFRVFVSPAGTQGPRAVFQSGQPGPRFESITDVKGNTILIAEAAEAVPWTKPDELVYHTDGPVPKLGTHFRNFFFPDVFFVTLADGSVRRYPMDLPEEKLRALITANGGEQIDDK